MAGYGNFTSQQNQSPTEKIAASTGQSASSGSSQNFAGSLSDKLVSVGASIGSVASTVAKGLTNISSSFKNDTTGLTPTNPQDLINSRKSFAGGKSFAESSMPSRVIDTAKVDTKANELIVYPPDMRKYYINFLFVEYQRPDTYKAGTFDAKLQIALPMPNSLLSPHGVKLNATELGGLTGQAADQISAVVNDMRSGGFTNPNAKNNAADLVNQAGAASYNMGQSLMGLIPGVAETAGQLLGAVPNPHVTVIFQGVDLRTHSFSWRFAPKNIDESMSVQRIVKEFKKRMLPNFVGGTSNILGYPSMVQITLEPDMTEQLYSFKKCMISSVNVNYAPNGVPSFFAGSKYPTVIEFQVNLQEIEIFTSEDYGGESGRGLVGETGMAQSVPPGQPAFTTAAEDALTGGR